MASDRERKFPCPTCKTEIVTEIPEGIFINKPTVSMLVMVHQEAAVCSGCGQPFCFVLRAIKGWEIGWLPVTIQQEEPGIITVPSLSLSDIEALRKKGN